MTDGPGQPAAVEPRGLRRDARRNYERIVAAARDVFGESGADAVMEEIAAQAGVGVGTVYRRFASKDALIDELLRLALADLLTDVHHALARADGFGLHELLHAFGRSFAEHARYANLLLQRQPDASAERDIRAAIIELTARAIAAGTVSADITVADVTALASGLRGLIHDGGEVSSSTWQRFLDLHLAGMGTPTT
ncbi:MAG TPA: helix-turn-helix domain-containing protein [Streptosporangiaceae bacterium]|nr:helix-turn-helix domain-containing protein [Streptosporangiaceae bacterium]